RLTRQFEQGTTESLIRLSRGGARPTDDVILTAPHPLDHDLVAIRDTSILLHLHRGRPKRRPLKPGEEVLSLRNTERHLPSDSRRSRRQPRGAVGWAEVQGEGLADPVEPDADRMRTRGQP